MENGNDVTWYLANDAAAADSTGASGAAVRVMSIDGGGTYGGTLHGTWTTENSISSSDRRLKTNIRPLQDTLRKNVHGKRPASIKPSAGAAGTGQPSVASWVLRQLRPVSYNFKEGSQSKFMRFGFIADEMEQILPEIVRELPAQDDEEKEKIKQNPEERKKGIAYNDLIAVLTTVVKDFNLQLKTLQGRMKTAEAELERLDDEDPMDGPDDARV